jgi:tetratricopeptide (TPR) repeat protein
VKDYDGAIAAGTQMVKADPKDWRSAYSLGLAYLEKRNWPEAAASFRRVTDNAVAERRYLASAWFHLGVSELWAGRHREAAEALEKGIALTRAGGHPLQQVPEDRAEYALRYRLAYLGDAYAGLGRYRNAVASYTADLAENRTNFISMADRARASLALGDFDAALADVDRYFAVPQDQRFKNPSGKYYDGFSYATAAFARVGLGDRAKALELLDRSKAVYPDPYDDELYAMVHLVAGDLPSAQAVLRNKAYWGVEFGKTADGGPGVELLHVAPQGAADRAGLRAGDIVAAIDRVPVESPAKFAERVQTMKPGARYAIDVRRGTQKPSLVLVPTSLGDLGEDELIKRYEDNPRVSAALRTRKLYREAESAEKRGMPRQALEILAKGATERGMDVETVKRIVTLSRKIAPPPAIPEEARRHAIFAQTALRDAKKPEEFDRAIQEFQTAQKIAPWWGDLYLNLGLAQEQRERFADARRSFELFLFAVPDAPERSTVRRKIYEMEFRAKLQPAAGPAAWAAPQDESPGRGQGQPAQEAPDARSKAKKKAVRQAPR